MKHLELFENFIITNTNALNVHKGKLCLHDDFGYLYIVGLIELGYWDNNREQDSNFKSYQIWGEVLDFANPSFKYAGPHHFNVNDAVILTPQELLDNHPFVTVEIYDALMSDTNLINQDIDIKHRFLDIFKDVDIDTHMETYRESIKYNI